MSTLKRFYLVVAACLALSFATIMPVLAQREDPEALHKQVIELFRAQRYADAIPLAERALAIRKKLLGAGHPEIALSLNNLALLYKAQDRYAEAEPLYKSAVAIYEKAFGPTHPYVAASLNNLAGLYDIQGLPDFAEPLYKRSLEIYEKAFGRENRNVSIALNNLALHYYARGSYANAEPLVRRTIEGQFAEKVIAYPVLFQSWQQNTISTNDAFDLGFETVQRVTSLAASNAASGLATRFAAGPDKELSDLLRKDQDLTAEAERLNKAMLSAVSKSPAERNVIVEDQVRRRIDAIKLNRIKLQQSLDQRFSEYVALSNPQPLSLKEAQSLLAEEEALVLFDFDAKSYAWIVTRTGSEWVELDVTAKTLDTQVAELRASLKDEGASFDTHLARWIYRETFGAFADKIASKTRLSVVTNGALAGLPLHLLVTKDPNGKHYKDVDWLARSYAITIWPSVANMKVLRGKSLVSSAPKPLIAFADPAFSSKESQQAPNKASIKSAPDRALQMEYDKLNAQLRQLTEMRREVEAVAKALDAHPNDIWLGPAATETAVRQARLNQYRIVYFATPRLDVGPADRFSNIKAESALALTTPVKRDEVDDGFLFASEIAQLKLNADWIVLSAGDALMGDEPGSDGLSALARAFFYAGGRSLLVSRWDVNDGQAVRLMTNTFLASSRDEKLTHSQALQQAMLAMLRDAKSDDDAHPRLWALFTVVGEPAADESDACFKESGDAAIVACSSLITSGRYGSPKLAQLFDMRGVEYRRKGQYTRAIVDYNEAIRLDPKYSRAYSNRAEVYRDKGEYDRAIADYSESIKLNPNDASAFNERGYVYGAKGEYDRAIADYDQAIKLDARNSLPLNNRENGAEIKDDDTRSILGFDAITREQPANADVLSGRCWAKAIIGRELQQALSDCNESLRLRANDAGALDGRGIAYFKLGQLDDAIADYDAALKLDPKKAASLYGRGMAKLKKGDTTGGYADIGAAKALEPEIVEQFAILGISPDNAQ